MIPHGVGDLSGGDVAETKFLSAAWLVIDNRMAIMHTRPTSFLARLSSGESSGSLGAAGSFSFLLPVSLPALEDLGFALAGLVDSFVEGDWVPLAALGVEVLVSLIFGFFTESER